MNNIVSHNYKIQREDREALHKHKSKCLWFTGLSGSGKSTIADVVALRLHHEGFKTYSLDGDNVRNGINNDLSFSDEDRSENIRRIAHIANLFVDSGTLVLAAFISPFKKDRALVKSIIGNADVIEIFIKTPLKVCEDRDVKGLYKKARSGEIKNFTGIDSKYEAPENPDICIDTEKLSVEESVNKILAHLKDILI